MKEHSNKKNKASIHWIKNRKLADLEELKSNIADFLLNLEDLTHVSRVLMDYFLFSYGCSQEVVNILREKYLIPELNKKTHLFKSIFIADKQRFAFLINLENYLTHSIDKEIFVRKFWAFVFEKFTRLGTLSLMFLKKHDEMAAVLHVDENYYADAKDLFARLKLPTKECSDSFSKKKALLKEVADTSSYRNFFFAAHAVTAPSNPYLLVAFLMLAQIHLRIFSMQAFPYLVTFVLVFGWINKSQRDNQLAYRHKGFRNTLDRLIGSEKFTEHFQAIISKYLEEVQNKINLIILNINVEINKRNTIVIESFQPNTISHLIELGEENINFTEIKPEMQSNFPLVKSLVRLDKKNHLKTFYRSKEKENKEVLCIVWKGAQITYNPFLYDEKIIKLWTCNPSLKHLNDQFYVEWDKHIIKKLIKQEIKKGYDTAHYSFWMIGVVGQIVSAKGKQGYVNKKNNDTNKKQFKLKLFGEYGSYRLFFNEKDRNDKGEIVLGCTAFKKTH